MYVTPDFKSKKALREAVASGAMVRVCSPGPFPCKMDGEETIEGPHYPEPHRWYARVFVIDGLVTKIIS
jgi:hypothetical protein